LDEALRVTNARTWLALFGLVSLLGMACAWGWEGSIATTVDGKGVVVRNGGVLIVASHGNGMVVELNVHVGDRIKRNQVIARVAQPELREQIREAEQILQEAKLESNRQLESKTRNSGVTLEALRVKQEMYTRQIQVLEDQVKLAAERARSTEQLAAKGLVTQQQVNDAKEKKVTLEGQIENARSEIKQLEVQDVSERQSPRQLAADMHARVAEAERRLASLQNDLRINGQVVSPYSGEVLELKADVGSNVVAGAPLISVQPVADTLELLLFLPAPQAKQVTPGMAIEVSPTTVKREESGFMSGKVATVSDYPVTEAALMRHFQNEVLVQSLLHDGPVTEVRARLEPDPQTPSGFHWSSGRGPAIQISSGTICTGRIVTKRQAPAELVIPYLKSKGGLN
jgi:HlyD family secretion protein